MMKKNLTNKLAGVALGVLLSGSLASAQTVVEFQIDSRLPEAPIGIAIDPTTVGFNNESAGTLASTTTGGYGNLSYAWTPENHLADPTVGSPSIDFTALYDSLGADPVTYTVVVTDANGCSDTAETQVTVLVSLAESLTLPLELTLSPNPSTGQLHLSLSGEAMREALQLEVLDGLGRNVYSENLGNFTGQLDRDFDLSHLGKGIYHLSLSSSQGRATSQIILQ